MTDTEQTTAELVDWSEIVYNLAELWANYLSRPGVYSWNRYEFLNELRDLTTQPWHTSDINFCDDCDEPGDSDVMNTTGTGYACESCYENYRTCEECGDASRDGMTETLYDEEVCDNCLNRRYSYCDECDGYYNNNYSDEHEHERDHAGCTCESPAQTFQLRNDGDPILDNDTRVTVSLPAGTISAEGIAAIGRYIRQEALLDGERDSVLYYFSYDLESLGDQWQTKDGNYTKRLSRLAYKSRQLKITPAMLSQIGCIARDHSTAVDFRIEATRDLNQSAADFYHEDSCWWQSYAYSRCTLKSNGGYGLRTFDSDGEVTGRAWVIPMALDEHGRLAPTFETLTPDAFLVFNGYGDLGGYAPARIVSHMAGLTYRKVSLYTDEMYVNGASGYLVAAEEVAANYTDGSMSLSLDHHSDLFATERNHRHAA